MRRYAVGTILIGGCSSADVRAKGKMNHGGTDIQVNGRRKRTKRMFQMVRRACSKETLMGLSIGYCFKAVQE